MRRLLLVLLLIVVLPRAAHSAPATAPATAPTTAPAGQPLPKSEVDRFVQPLTDGQWCGGVVVAVITEKGTQINGYGRISETNNRAPDGDTVYEIGSVSKVFTSLLLAEMVRDGQVALDDPVQKNLPDSVTMPQRNGKTITLQHLATHTSGLPRMPDNFRPKDKDNPYADYTVEQMYAFLSGCKPARDPGEAYEYSNLAVGLLGHVLARRAGTSYEGLLVNRIAKPLGMSDTCITLSDDQRRRLAPGHDGEGAAVANWDIPTFAGAGAIRSTANDMAKFVAAQLGLTTVGPDLAAAMEMTQVRRSTAAPGTDMGLGWHIDTKNSFVWHNGQTGGYHSYVGLCPSRRCGIVLLTGTAGGLIDTTGARLLLRMTGQSAEPVNLPVAIAVEPKTLERYVGRYLLGLTALMTITRDGDRLYAQLAGQQRFRIWPKTETQFFWRSVNAQLDFTVGDDGNVMKLVLHQNGKDMTAQRISADGPTTVPAR